ncbi:hypothetical protein FRB90_006071 [Tulasnella sp. 427]|nr:hypothetical protein FRB90_006071 [Tulasnella sp. 427]
MDAHTAASHLLQASSPTSDPFQLFHAPIYSLPPELIVYIIQYVLEPDTRLRGLVQLSQVCREWRMILDDAPFLWASINAAEGGPPVSIAFVRAMNAPLILEYRDKTALINRPTFFRLAGERIGHWKSLSVYLSGYSGSWDVILNDLETRTAPRLEELLLHGGYVMEERMDQVTLFGGASAPASLKKLSLSHIAIDIAALHLRGLKSLNLHAIPEITSLRLFEIMVESPHIEAMELNHISSLTGSIQSDSDRHRYSNISLSHLTHLAVVDLPISFLNLLLSTIQLPTLRTMELDCEIQSQPTSQLLSVGLRHQVSTLAAIVSGAQNYKVTLCSHNYYQITIGGFDITFFMDVLSMDHFQECFDWISKFVGVPLKELPLELDLDDCDPEPSYLEWFSRRTNATKLRLYSDPYCGTPLERIIPYLGRPTLVTPVIWLVPRVEILTTNLVWHEGNLDIVEMLERRYSTQDHPELAAPTPFREIRLSYGGKGSSGWPHVNQEFMAEVARIAQGADVYWEGQKWLDLDFSDITTANDCSP